MADKYHYHLLSAQHVENDGDELDLALCSYGESDSLDSVLARHTEHLRDHVRHGIRMPVEYTVIACSGECRIREQLDERYDGLMPATAYEAAVALGISPYHIGAAGA
jgi:hypothetical protein